MVEDMSVVYPRTNGAWMAILSGQYPLTIEGVARWTAEAPAPAAHPRAALAAARAGLCNRLLHAHGPQLH
ncbi:hypothetical protein AB4Z46_15180 [Variovorax sp. M-6]|uniref:hypothetical protein n=1 Tax=Variovorax sp. M-6 TaxID=3233041 RepID=UPI003F97EDB2